MSRSHLKIVPTLIQDHFKAITVPQSCFKVFKVSRSYLKLAKRLKPAVKIIHVTLALHKSRVSQLLPTHQIWLFFSIVLIYEPSRKVIITRSLHVAQWRSHWGGKWGGGRVPPLTAKICQKSGKNQEKSGKNQEKSGRKGQNRGVSFTLPLLTDRAGYATGVARVYFLLFVIDLICEDRLLQSFVAWYMNRPSGYLNSKNLT